MNAEPATALQIFAGIAYMVGITLIVYECLAILIDWRHED